MGTQATVEIDRLFLHITKENLNTPPIIVIRKENAVIISKGETIIAQIHCEYGDDIVMDVKIYHYKKEVNK